MAFDVVRWNYTPSGYESNLSNGKIQVVKVYTPNGQFLDVIKDAPYVTGFTCTINAAPSVLSLVLPRPVDAYDSKGTIVLGNNVQVWVYGAGLPQSGKLVYNGVIDAIEPTVSADGSEYVTLKITPYGTILGDHGIIGPLAFGTAGNASTYVDVATILGNLFTSAIDSITGQPYGYPFTLAPTNPTSTGNLVQYMFQNQTLFQGLTQLLLLAPANYYFVPNMDKTFTFKQQSTTPQHTFALGQHFSTFQYSFDNTQRKNVCVVQGKGVQGVAIGASVKTIGQRIYFKQDSRITDQNTAQTLANGLLALYDRPLIRTKCRILDVRGDNRQGIGYDIESINVGETVTILNPTGKSLQTVWGNFTWGQAQWGYDNSTIFNQVQPIVAYTYNYDSLDIEIGSLQPSMSRNLFDLEVKFADATIIQ